jgi:hypothetical protein
MDLHVCSFVYFVLLSFDADCLLFSFLSSFLHTFILATPFLCLFIFSCCRTFILAFLFSFCPSLFSPCFIFRPVLQLSYVSFLSFIHHAYLLQFCLSSFLFLSFVSLCVLSFGLFRPLFIYFRRFFFLLFRLNVTIVAFSTRHILRHM